jgi:voltage-gated potassium channel
VLSLLIGLAQLGRAIARSLHDPEFRALLVLYVILLAIGSLFYSRVEGWPAVDAVYFCVVTLATVGYGDFAPRTTLGKGFTIVYVLIGAGVFVALAARLALAVMGVRRTLAGDEQRHT